MTNRSRPIRPYDRAPARLALVITSALLTSAIGSAANAAVVIQVDKSSQTMSVVVDGQPRHTWPVSTGKAGYSTPTGTFAPQRLARSHFSRTYYNSPMPHSIFFHGGYAIHGSNAISQLGGPASHGCVRLHPSHAAALFSLVQQHGAGSTRIVISGSSGGGYATAPVSRSRRAVPAGYGYAPEYPGYQSWPGYQTYPGYGWR